MRDEFVCCKCGKRNVKRKMREVSGELLCPRCAKIAEGYAKWQAKHAENYQVVVMLLDGSRLFYQPVGG